MTSAAKTAKKGPSPLSAESADRTGRDAFADGGAAADALARAAPHSTQKRADGITVDPHCGQKRIVGLGIRIAKAAGMTGLQDNA